MDFFDRDLEPIFPGLVQVSVQQQALHLIFDVGLRLKLSGSTPAEWYRSLRIQDISDAELLWNLGSEPDSHDGVGVNAIEALRSISARLTRKQREPRKSQGVGAGAGGHALPAGAFCWAV